MLKKIVGLCVLISVVGANADSTPKRPLQLVSSADQKTYEGYIQRTGNADLISRIPEMVFYSEHEMPRMFQIDEFSGTFTGFHVSPGGTGYTEPNMFFPWKSPAGLRDASNAASFKFMILPAPKGETRANDEKIQVWREFVQPANGNSALEGSYRWEFPVGTTFGEVLLVRDPKNLHHVFEVRLRTKEAKGLEKGWVMDSLRPFRNVDELYQRSEKLAQTEEFRGDKKVEAFVDYLSEGHVLPVQYLADGVMGGNAFETDYAAIDYLPEVPEQFVVRLLQTPFVSVRGEQWRQMAEAPSAPATKAAFHIVPNNANLAFVHVDKDSCMRCHSASMKHAVTFSGLAPNGSDWYGFVRGSDGILSFYPVIPQGNGSKTIRPEFIQAGILNLRLQN